MNTIELEKHFNDLIPATLSCAWDNDGLMCSSDSYKEIKSALLTLDITESAVEKALELGVDAIFTHHPFVFRGMKSVTDKNARSRLLITLLSHGISVFSYHTRLDAVDGGVNDILADLIGLKNTASLGDGELSMARIGEVDRIPLDLFADCVKEKLKCPSLVLARSETGSVWVKRAVVLGGSCDMDFIHGAIAAGADVLVTGDASYNALIDANIDGTRKNIEFFIGDNIPKREHRTRNFAVCKFHIKKQEFQTITHFLCLLYSTTNKIEMQHFSRNQM